MSFGMFFGGIVIGFVRGWIFTLCILGLSPIMFIIMGIFGK